MSVWEALGTVRDPELDQPITDLGFVASASVAGGHATVRLRLPTYFCAPNFAYLMVADAHDAVRALPSVSTVDVQLVDHFAAAEINAGVSGEAGFSGSFPGEAVAELDDLRLTFRRKAYLASLDRLATRLTAAGVDPVGLTLGEVACQTETMRQSDSQRLVVLGATGGTGRAVVEVALRAGHNVTAVTRRADALPPAPGLAVAVLPELADHDRLAEVVADHDVVISALGTAARGPVTVCTDGIRAVLRAMGETGVRRLVVVSAHGAAESRDRSPYSLALWASVGHKMRDKESMEALVRASDTAWTIVRPPALRNTAPSGRYRTGTDLRIRLTTAVSRADLADFLVREAVAPAYLHDTPRIAA